MTKQERFTFKVLLDQNDDTPILISAFRQKSCPTRSHITYPESYTVPFPKRFFVRDIERLLRIGKYELIQKIRSVRRNKREADKAIQRYNSLLN